MSDLQTIERLESRLVDLVEGMLAQKSGQMNFLIGLNRLDDILIEHQQGQPIAASTIEFLEEYRHWREDAILNKSQTKRLGDFLSQLHQVLVDKNEADSLKPAEELKQWLQSLGGGAFRLTLKKPAEQVSLAERFRTLNRRENEELEAVLADRDHLLTALDDILKSAESKTDPMYRHLAASIIYFLQMEGYKADPYIKRLRRINAET